MKQSDVLVECGIKIEIEIEIEIHPRCISMGMDGPSAISVFRNIADIKRQFGLEVSKVP
jgi:hypothetical protein